MKTIHTLLLLLATFLTSHAQDTLTRTDGKKVGVIIKKVRSFDVIYTKAEWPAGKTRTVSKSIIANIAYADGRVDTFFVVENNNTISKASPMLRADSMAEYGRRDAKIYYTKFTGAATGTLLATFPGSPVLGLITAISTSSTMPKSKNMQFPNAALAANDDYWDGYTRKAWHIKSGKVWGNWGLGLGLTAATFLMLGLISGR